MAEWAEFNSYTVISSFLMRTFLSSNLTCGFITKHTKAKLSDITDLPMSIAMTLRAGIAIDCASWID